MNTPVLALNVPPTAPAGTPAFSRSPQRQKLANKSRRPPAGACTDKYCAATRDLPLPLPTLSELPLPTSISTSDAAAIETLGA